MCIGRRDDAAVLVTVATCDEEDAGAAATDGAGAACELAGDEATDGAAFAV